MNLDWKIVSEIRKMGRYNIIEENERKNGLKKFICFGLLLVYGCWLFWKWKWVYLDYFLFEERLVTIFVCDWLPFTVVEND